MKYDKVIMWGFKHTYNTYGHIHEGFARAFKHMGWETYWVDEKSLLSRDYFYNAIVLTEHQAVNKEMPVRDDCFYLVHNLNGGSFVANELLKDANKLHFGVYVTNTYSDHGPITWLDKYTPLYKDKRVLEIMWATDIMPEEIEYNKTKATVLNTNSKAIHWVGSGRRTLLPFARAAAEAGVEFYTHSSNDQNYVSVEENVRLIQESRFAPALVDDYQLTHPYIPCRIFKNISYGQFGVTNSEMVNKFFEGKLICDPNSYNLFHKAERELRQRTQYELWNLMDYVKNEHTYINRANAVLRAVEVMNA